MNNFKIEICENNKWVDYTKHAVFPPKFANLLDEQLDEANISLKRVPKEYFRQMLKARVTFINKPEALYSEGYYLHKIKNRAETQANIVYDKDSKRITETLTINYIIANDNAIEYKYGNKIVYDHEIYLIELTKILEGFIGDSLTFTNTLGEYDEDAEGYPAELFADGDYAGTVRRESEGGNIVSSPIPMLLEQKFPLLEIIKNHGLDLSYSTFFNNYISWDGFRDSCRNEVVLTIYKNGEVVKQSSAKYNTYDYSFSSPKMEGDDFLSFTPDRFGRYVIEYKISENANKHSVTIVFNATIGSGGIPLKKWTIADVVVRLCDLIIPIRHPEFENSNKHAPLPRFRLQGAIYENGECVGYKEGSLAEKLDKIISPEFSFSQMTFREQLKQVGGRIHGEPRITDIKYDDDGTPWFELGFDFYGGNEYSNIKKRHRVSASFKTDINDYCTSLDSSVDNLVNQLNWAQGVVIEPFEGGGITIRSESTTSRIEENNSAFIPTSKPIYNMGVKEQVFVTYIPGEGAGAWDISNYIIEEVDYNTYSSYDEKRNNKAKVLYYKQGERNIKGLFFKNPSAVSSVFERYAIINILRAVTGKKINITGNDYRKLQFEIRYAPIGRSRVKTNKQIVVGGLPRTLAYNQSANLIETTFMGENLKGAVERMGNVEKTYTYHLAFLSDIPKPGTLFDDNYYISTVSVEYLPTYIKCTVGLSKDFNRLSENVGISSENRMWEVSEKQAFSRDSIYFQYLFISQEEQDSDTKALSLTGGAVPTLFNKSDNSAKGKITNVCVQRFYKDKNNIYPKYLTLPAYSLALGNSMMFSFNFEDNYSAGQKSEYTTGKQVGNEDLTTGYWGKYVPYGDDVGRFWWLSADFYRSNEFLNDGNNESATALSLPEGKLENESTNRLFNQTTTHIKYRKDSREIPSITYAINMVTDDESIVIGSALASNCSLVNAKPEEYEFYFLPNKLNRASSIINLTEDAIRVPFGRVVFENDYLTIPTVQGSFESWAIVTKLTKTKFICADENGMFMEQTIYKGGELVIGQNKIPENKTFYFRMKEKIYEI